MNAQHLLDVFKKKSQQPDTTTEAYFVVAANEVGLAELDAASVSTLQKSNIDVFKASVVDQVAFEILQPYGPVQVEAPAKASQSFAAALKT